MNTVLDGHRFVVSRGAVYPLDIDPKGIGAGAAKAG
jgi:hypothetical protein